MLRSVVWWAFVVCVATLSLRESLYTQGRLDGTAAHLSYPYVTAGNRLYSFGTQDGQFPDVGWHIHGEMGGIWHHPIKLADGFIVKVTSPASSVCLEKADSFSNFPAGNSHVYTADPLPLSLAVTRSQFVPHDIAGLIVEFEFENLGHTAQDLRVDLIGLMDVSPTWLSEHVGQPNGPDEARWDPIAKAMLAREIKQNWFATFASDKESTVLHTDTRATASTLCTDRREFPARGVDVVISLSLHVPSRGSATVPLYVTGSTKSEEEALEILSLLREHSSTLLHRKLQRFDDIASIAKVDLPDHALTQAFEWTKYTNDWLIRTVSGVGEGLTAGLPEYPWFFGCDSTYALQGVLATGRPDVARNTLQLLQRLSAQHNRHSGKIIHESSTNGLVFHYGNVQESGHFVMMVWTYFEWTADIEFLREMWPQMKMAIQWLFTVADIDGDMFPNGSAITEIDEMEAADMELIDSVVYSQQALVAASLAAEVLGDAQLQNTYSELADTLRSRIEAFWWVEEESTYADFFGSPAQAERTLQHAIDRARGLGEGSVWALERLLKIYERVRARLDRSSELGHAMYHNWVVLTPAETGIASRDRALRSLDTAWQYVGPLGLHITGIDVDKSEKAKQQKKEDSFRWTYIGKVMPIATGVMAVAEAKYGRIDNTLELLRRTVASFGSALPGSIYEVSPDIGCAVQAWTIYTMAVPIIQHIFGVRPTAHRQRVLVRPRVPSAWKQEPMSLSRLPVADVFLDVHRSVAPGESVSYTFRLHQPADATYADALSRWTVHLMLPAKTGPAEGLSCPRDHTAVTVNRSRVRPTPVPASEDGEAVVLVPLKGAFHEVVIRCAGVPEL